MFEGWPPPILDPAGPYASSVSLLSWILFAMGAAVLLIVLIAVYIAIFGRASLQTKLGGKMAIWVGGIAFPVVVLTILLVYGLSLTRHLSDPIEGTEMRVRITGEMWWWRVAYLDAQGRSVVHDANELHIPTGRPVVLELESADVIHSFWVPRLSGKLDMIPGRRNLMKIQADVPGTFGGQCAEYCGGPHALMGFKVVAHDPVQFARLMQNRMSRETAPPSILGGGARLFETSGCAACHRIAGTSANGLAGPDLTHVGSRGTLGAGILPNNRGTMMGWIGNSQAIKPNNRMPPYTLLTSEQLAQLAIYLEEQK
ncbi:cytochrome c oxidase subunit II [Sphingorhabdus sp.]|uniref:cytochrome c oxidase subunit II n=1 Tax=Sphingorhabdus sp. TaxID=1902408 RepID=UPI00391AF23E